MRTFGICTPGSTGARYRARPSRRMLHPEGRRAAAAARGRLVWRTRSSSGRWSRCWKPIYEQDFLGFSYGFRPGRSPHHALDALAVGDQAQEGELGARRGHPRLSSRSLDHLVAWEVPRAPNRGPAGPAPDPEMAQGWNRRGRGMVGDRSGNAAGRVSFDAARRTCTCTMCSTSGFTTGGGRHARGEVIVVRYCDDFVAGLPAS